MSATPGTNAVPISGAYAPRPITPQGVREVSGWKLKHYTITCAGTPFQGAGYEEGLELGAARWLTQPPVADGRFGVGVCIFNQGARVDYVVLAWWGRENEFPIRVMLRDREPLGPWREAEGDESICVWDLQVCWHERNAWVETVLSRPDAPDIDDYLSRFLTIEA